MNPAKELDRVSFLSSPFFGSRHEESYVRLATPQDNRLEQGALRSGGAPNIWSRRYIGLLAQYAAVGLLYGALPGVIYPFLLNYLQMEGTQLVSARVLLMLPWSFKVVYGVICDCYPIFGYRRRPFMIIGWTLCFVVLLVMGCMDAGDPYFPDPQYVHMNPVERPSNITSIVNFDAPEQGSKFIVLMTLAAVAYVGSDVAADGLVVELAQREPESIRGKTQTTVYLVRTIFVMISNVFIGFAFNGHDYGGEFNFSLSFPQLMVIIAFCILPVIPVTWYFIDEEKHPGSSLKEYMIKFWTLLQMRSMYQVIAYKFLSGLFESFTITCGDPMQSYWAEATPLNDKIFTIVGTVIFASALFFTGKFGLQWDWRWMHAITLVSVLVVDMIVSFLTTWDIVRNQWFWLGVPIVENIPQGVGFIIATYVVVELCDGDSEAAVYGLVTTVSNLASPFASSLTKTVNAQFDVTNTDIMIDSTHVRWDVTYVLIIRYLINFCGLLFLPLLPRQKAETQQLRREGGSSRFMGYVTLTYVLIALAWSVAVNALSINQSTSCLVFVGGNGCS